MAMNWNSRHIEAFRAVMTVGNVTQAAQLLHSSQPAVSQLIAALEHATQLKLFERQRGRLAPTPEARILFAEVERSYVGLSKIQRTIDGLRQLDNGYLHIGCLPALGLNFMPAVIAGFQRAFPNIRVSLQTLPSPQVRDLVASGQLDLGLASDEIDTRGVSASTFVRLAGVCVMADTHPLARKKSINIGDLRGQRFLALNPDHKTRRELEQAAQASGFAIDVVVETPYAATICALAQRDAGIGIVNPLTAADYHGQGLQIREFTPAIYFHTLKILPPGDSPSRITLRFLEQLNDELASCGPLVNPPVSRD